MKYLTSYKLYESHISNHIKSGLILLTTLLSIPNFANGQTKQQIEQKAQLSTLDDESLESLLDSIYSKGYVLYNNKIKLNGNNYLFTSATDLKLKQALSDAKKDANIKIQFLGIEGRQLIFTNKTNSTHSVIIITEIRDENYKPLFDRESDQQNTPKW